jgi:uncharacterized membrane protein YeaQ/YmgE (transglycosylase-associated protein family)
MTIITWLLAGGLTGWAASYYLGNTRTETIAFNIVVAVLGAAFLGWAGAPLLAMSTGYRPVEFLASTFGAAVVLACVHVVQRVLAR